MFSLVRWHLIQKENLKECDSVQKLEFSVGLLNSGMCSMIQSNIDIHIVSSRYALRAGVCHILQNVSYQCVSYVVLCYL